MPTTRKPRSGSLQFWPRVRALRSFSRVRSWDMRQDGKGSICGFAGYKIGMSHAIITDNRKTSKTKGQDISIPVTLVECPPLHVLGVRIYKKNEYGSFAFKDVLSKKDKYALKKLTKTKKGKEKEAKNSIDDLGDDVSDVRLIIQTIPSATTIGKKKPEIFELGLEGKIADKIAFAKEKVGTNLAISDVFKEGMFVDSHAVTKGKGFQGPVKRFGISLRSHKSEKTIRGPGSLMAWTPHHGNFYVAHAGQMGYHSRIDYNKLILKIAKPEEVKSKGGFLRYGDPKNECLVISGSLPGASKRLVIFTKSIRKTKPVEAPAIVSINQDTKQRR